jgi:hypothetical protein
VVAVGLTVTAVPLAAVRLPGVITPVPPVKTPVRLVLPPAVIVAGLAVKLVIEGVVTAAFTVTVAVFVTAVPSEAVTVSVYVVVAVGLTLTAVPLVAVRLPGVITPVPPEKTPVRLTLAPAVIVARLAVKLVIDGAVPVVVVEPEPPPQPAKQARPTLRAIAHTARTENLLIIFPVLNGVECRTSCVAYTPLAAVVNDKLNHASPCPAEVIPAWLVRPLANSGRMRISAHKAHGLLSGFSLKHSRSTPI